jgi:hypothetical protein
MKTIFLVLTAIVSIGSMPQSQAKDFLHLHKPWVWVTSAEKGPDEVDTMFYVQNPIDDGPDGVSFKLLVLRSMNSKSTVVAVFASGCKVGAGSLTIYSVEREEATWQVDGRKVTDVITAYACKNQFVRPN